MAKNETTKKTVKKTETKNNVAKKQNVKKVEPKKPSAKKVEPKKKETKTKVMEKADKELTVKTPKKKTVENSKAKEPITKISKETNSGTVNSKSKLREAINQSKKKEIVAQGIVSSEVNDVIKARKSKKTIENETVQKLIHAMKNGDFLWGKVVGVSRDPKHKENLYANVIFDNLLVLIKDSDFFEKDYYFGNTYSTLSDIEKSKWREIALNRYKTAAVCFTVTGYHERKIDDGPFKGETIYVLDGNRRAAMNILKDIYFFHKNRKKDTPNAPRSISIGSVVECRVVDVTYNTATVECCGVETRIQASELSNDYIKNCFDVVHVGDIKTFVVKGLTIKDGAVSLVLTGRTMETPKEIKLIMRGSQYSGTVLKYNEEKDIYTITLDLGSVTASVYRNNVQGYSDVAPGDRVSVFVTQVYDTHVVGNLIKMI